MLAFDAMLPALLLIPLAIVAAAAFGAAWAADPGLSAGLSRQPHRHHHDHVQLHRRGADGLSAGQRADRAGLDVARDARVRRGGPAAAASTTCWRCIGIAIGALAAQCLDLPRARCLRRSSGSSSGTRRWGFELRAIGPQRRRPRSMPASSRAASSCWRCACRARSRASSASTRSSACITALILNFTAGYGFGGIAVALMGRNHPARHRAREPAVRRALSGRRRACVRDPDDHQATWSW